MDLTNITSRSHLNVKGQGTIVWEDVRPTKLFESLAIIAIPGRLFPPIAFGGYVYGENGNEESMKDEKLIVGLA